MSAKISCDQCNNDLTGGGPHPGWRLVIHPDRIPTGDTEHALLVHPPMPMKVHHFCGWPCLDRWRAGQPSGSQPHRTLIDHLNT